jgi:regulator of protease activity HflC (stomatin/prohibitin superfamily)
MERLVKFLFSFGVFIILFFIVFSVEYVGPGYVGIKVNLYGSDRGVDQSNITTGYVWYCRWTTKVYEYPTFLQRTVFTKDINEDSPTNEEINFGSKEGMQVFADIGLNYQIPAEHANKLFVKIRGDEKAVRQYLKGKMRDAISSVASEMSINEIYGEGKMRLLAEAKKMLETNTDNEIDIDMLGFVSALRLPDNVQESIDATIRAKQKAIEANNKIEQTKAEAQQQIEEARGKSEAVILAANKQAEANITLAKSLTPELIKWKALEKWNGTLPQVVGEATPLINLQNSK